MQKNCLYSKNKSVKETTFAALLKAVHTRRKPANPNHIIFFSDDNFLNQDQKPNSQNNSYQCSDHEDVPLVVHTQDWLKANLMKHWLKGLWIPSSPD
jgi:hypothetical protein